MFGIVGAFKNSCNGLKVALNEDKSWRNTVAQSLIGFLISSCLLYRGDISPMIWLLLTGSLFPMVIVETINCSIEAVTDKASPERSVLAKKAKDLGSAAVLLSRLFAILCWAVTLHTLYV